MQIGEIPFATGRLIFFCQFGLIKSGVWQTGGPIRASILMAETELMDSRALAGVGATLTVPTERDAILAYLSDRTEESFCVVARLFTPKLLGYFGVRGMDFHAAEEMCQDVLLSCHRHADSLRAPEAFGAWLFRIAHNVLLSRIRGLRREIATVQMSSIRGDVGGSPPLSFAGFELSDLLAGLAEEEREILALRYLDGFGYEEIGEILGIPAGTAKWRVFDAKRKVLGRARVRRGRTQ